MQEHVFAMLLGLLCFEKNNIVLFIAWVMLWCFYASINVVMFCWSLYKHITKRLFNVFFSVELVMLFIQYTFVYHVIGYDVCLGYATQSCWMLLWGRLVLRITLLLLVTCLPI